MRQAADQEVLKEGRKKPLKDVDAPLKEQVSEKLVKKLQDLNEGMETVNIWDQANARRSDWLTRQSTLLEEYDEFLEPIYNKSQAWSSTLHLPVALTVAKTFHARFYAALMSVDPPFTVTARQGHNVDRAMLIQNLMRYTINSWVNNYKGIDEVIDRWLWDWIVGGVGILKQRWDVKYTRFVDVVKKQKKLSSIHLPHPETGDLVEFPQIQEVEEEEEVTKEVFNGPMMECIPAEELVIVGGGGDPDEADDVIQSVWLTASELWTLADRGVFRYEAVEKIIASDENLKSAEQALGIQVLKTDKAGTGSLDMPYDHKRYQILERYARIDVDGSGITSEVVLWVHKQTREIARATYLRRVNKEGLRPFVKIDFHKRHGDDYGVGIIELLYTLTKELDAMHNMKIDFGLISSMPIGFYRATSSMSTERLPMEPGMLIPLDNPQTDIHFPNMGARWSFTEGEEHSLMQQIERLTSISDMSLGVIGGQGAARTATGARALLGESNANLDVFLRRMNRGWKRALVYLFQMLQEKLPPGFQFRVLGDDGSMYWESIKSTEELCGMYDFELEANSANSNKQIQIEQANSIFTTIANPLFIQLGIVTPLEIYAALKYKFQVEGVRDFSRFIKKPQGMERVYTPGEIADAVLAGVDIPLSPMQDLQGFIDFFQHVHDTDELLGQFNEQQTIQLAKKAQQAQQMLDAVNAQKAQVANQQQMAANQSMAVPNPQAQPLAAPVNGRIPAQGPAGLGMPQA